MKSGCETFLRHWTYRNVQNSPFAESVEVEIRALLSKLVADGSAAGYGRRDLEGTVGDLQDYVREAFEAVQDLELGFKDPS